MYWYLWLTLALAILKKRHQKHYLIGSESQSWEIGVEQRSIVRAGIAESKEATEGIDKDTTALLPVEFGHGHHEKTGTKNYGADWEMY